LPTLLSTSSVFSFFFPIRRPPRSTRFPYTSLFRSHHAGRARRRVRLHVGRVALGDPGRSLDLQGAAADPLFPRQYGIRALPPDTSLAGRVPTHRGSASPAVRRAGGFLLVVAAAFPQSAATAQQTSPYVAAERAESLRLAGRPWHA